MTSTHRRPGRSAARNTTPLRFARRDVRLVTSPTIEGRARMRTGPTHASTMSSRRRRPTLALICLDGRSQGVGRLTRERASADDHHAHNRKALQ